MLKLIDQRWPSTVLIFLKNVISRRTCVALDGQKRLGNMWILEIVFVLSINEISSWNAIIAYDCNVYSKFGKIFRIFERIYVDSVLKYVLDDTKVWHKNVS